MGDLRYSKVFLLDFWSSFRSDLKPVTSAVPSRFQKDERPAHNVAKLCPPTEEGRTSGQVSGRLHSRTNRVHGREFKI